MILSFFTDPILRAPTIGTILMCMTCALVGVLVFLRKESLVAEALSHAAYPGVGLGILFAGFFFPSPAQETKWAASILLGAFLSAVLGLRLIYLLQNKYRVSADSALCFVLSSFFGVGILLASTMQFSYTSLYVFAQTYLYGQAATMVDRHILIYGILCLCTILILLALYKEWQAITFDPVYAQTIGIPTQKLDQLLIFLICIAVVVGIRSVGVVLISGMFIAPAIAARQYSHRLSVVFLFAALFGALSAFFGNYFSVQFAEKGAMRAARLILPTGPMILLVAASITLLSLIFAPMHGILWRWSRMIRFRFICFGENILKELWRGGPEMEQTIEQIAQYHPHSRVFLHFRLWCLKNSGWVELSKGSICLTHDGKHRAEKIVRLHRLWEVYLADYVGVGKEKVHLNAEEMEHVITPALEKELTLLLHDPKMDPHQQPIPPFEGNR